MLARVLWRAVLSVGVFVFVCIVLLLETDEIVYPLHAARNESAKMPALTITCVSVYTDGFNFLPALGGLRQPALFFSPFYSMKDPLPTHSFPPLQKIWETAALQRR